MGGLSRKAALLKQISASADKPVLRIDGGALLFEQPVIPPTLLPTRMILARGISQAVQTMHYAAIGVAPQDLTAGVDFLLQQGREQKLPWLSANLTDQNGKRLLEPFLLTKAGTTSVAIIGLTGEAAAAPGGQTGSEYRIRPWPEVLPETLAQVKGQEFVILLSSYPEPVNRQIADKFPEIQLIIQSGTFTANKTPELVGNTLITQVAARGKYLGRLDINWRPGHHWSRGPALAAQLRQAKDNLARIDGRLNRLAQQPGQQELPKNSEYPQLKNERERLTALIAGLEQSASGSQEGLSTYTSTLIPMQVSLPEDPEVQKIVQQTKQAIRGGGQQKREGTQQQPGRPPEGKKP